jgi:hypothetical protein
MTNLMLSGVSLWFAVLLSVPVLGQKRNEGKAQSPPPPGAQRTVETITGKWPWPIDGQSWGSDRDFNWSMDCKTVALGAGAACSNRGDGSIGVVAESCLLAYDPDGKAVHYRCVTSMGKCMITRGIGTTTGRSNSNPSRRGQCATRLRKPFDGFSRARIRSRRPLKAGEVLVGIEAPSRLASATSS